MHQLFHSEGQQLKRFSVLFTENFKREAVQFTIVQTWAGTEKLAQQQAAALHCSWRHCLLHLNSMLSS